ncbi:MAG TPA: hypothetical protein VNI83_09905 [Vicinamibacterales bacterium]|nr:hypothetical protein [Vicinamibacterales bacterium]
MSDQAFYMAAVLDRLDPGLFPRDSPLLDAQARLTGADEAVAALARLAARAGRSLPAVALLLHALSLLLLYSGALAIGARVYGSAAAAAALALALTLRHGIPRAGVNSLEGYFHPRLLVFACGIVAVALFLRGRRGLPLILVAVAGLVHPTTGVWFALWLGFALWVADPPARRWLALGAAMAGTAALWALVDGPLAGRLVRMDGDWLAAIGDRTYLYPDTWPVYAWVANGALVPIILLVHHARRRAGLAGPREDGLVAGAMALVAVFLLALPLVALRIALAVQLQVGRVFWMLDFLATVLLVWLLARRRPAIAAAVLALCTMARGAYSQFVSHPDRPLVQVGLPAGDWRDAMAWAAQTPKDTHWLADPGHAFRYGSSLRIAAGRDVFLEGSKDGALAIYDRQVAARVLERVQAIGDFSALTAARARALAARYDLDYLVTEARLELPVFYRAGRLFIYRLAPPRRVTAPPAPSGGE